MIREAETTIAHLRKNPILNVSNITILTANKWSENSHLLARSLDHDELTLINRFFTDCVAINRSINQLSSETQIKEKITAIQHTLCKLALEEKNDTYEKNKKKFLYRNKFKIQDFDEDIFSSD